MSRVSRRPALVAGLALVVAACGSGASPSPSSASPAGTPSSTAAASEGTGPATSPGASGGSAGAPGAGGGGGASASPPIGGASGGVASQLQQAFIAVVQQVGPSVVVIETSEGLGSGVVFDDRGDIVTNAHVVGNARSFKVTTAAGDTLDASLVGTFVPNDLAVVRVSGGDLTPATFGDSSALVVGDVVLAIGNPLGLQSSVTDGIVSAIGRTVQEPNGTAIPNAIQTSAPINPGNSGGALANLAGEVVGIPTLAATDPQIGGTAPGIGFAIPSNTAKDIAQQLIDHGKVVSSHRAYLGIRAADVQGGQGVLVYSVEQGGPADQAGLPAGVLITSIDGKPTPDSGTLAAVLAGLEPGKTVAVETLSRDGSTKTYQVTLGELPG
ncbi:MAG TPA: trypsin-like peptidase domain-containing protein [Candidatus Limnocylindrales bacterium]|nr:trypsin-like peptidase domain-containing protein [Candidatus Limnocylindrales bacterium]